MTRIKNTTTQHIKSNTHTQHFNQPPPLPFTQLQNYNTYNNPAISSNPCHFFSFQNPTLSTYSYNPYPTMQPAHSSFSQLPPN